MEKVCVLTYQMVHRKTYDTIARLKAFGYSDVTVYAKPFHYQKRYVPYFDHRPNLMEDFPMQSIGYEDVVRNYGYALKKIQEYDEIEEQTGTIFLVCGAGIIPKSVLDKYRLINAHPGYIPYVRGLDALKWAFMEHHPIGVTTHLLGEYIDAGYVLERKTIAVYPGDTLHAVAYRQYELEIQMLVNAIEKCDTISFFTDGEGYPIHRRMPYQQEIQLESEFQKYKEMQRVVGEK